MKFFNRNYMIQNLKKSKSVLAFFLGVLPIVSMIIFLVLASVAGYSYISLESISVIHYFGIYFVPLILSVCLFGFVYKKKSVDFTCSMPLSRKTIFITNTITGILLLILMVVISGFGIYGIGVLTGTIIPFKMILDYMLIWSITYIFVFILSNIAMCVSGNIATCIVVTMLLLFLVPFLIDYVTDGNFIIYGVGEYRNLCIENVDLSTNKMCNIIETSNSTNYTLPYNNIRSLLSGDGIYNMISLIKMVIVSIAGIIIGKIMFVKRKMENNQTSFKNLKVHSFVKALTMVPIIALISAMIPEENISLLLISCIFIFLLVYFIIYDFITKKSLTDIKNATIHFLVSLLVLFMIFIPIDHHFENSNDSYFINIDSQDIKEIHFSLNTTGLSLFEYIEVKDTKSLELILNKLTETIKEPNDILIYKELEIKTSDNSYKISVHFNENAYLELVDYIKKTTDFKKIKTLLDDKKVYALGFEQPYINGYTNNSKVINEAKNIIENNPSKSKCNYMNEALTVYAYDKGNVYSYQIDSCKSEILSDYVEEVINRENKEFLDRIKNLSYTSASVKGISYGINSYNVNSSNIGFEDLDEGLYKHIKEVYLFMKKYSNDKFDINKYHIAISGYLGDDKYIYYTNRVDELLAVLEVEKEDFNDIN